MQCGVSRPSPSVSETRHLNNPTLVVWGKNIPLSMRVGDTPHRDTFAALHTSPHLPIVVDIVIVSAHRHVLGF